ncbi:hypothetical protein D3C77_358120 [compost metagenome]
MLVGGGVIDRVDMPGTHDVDQLRLIAHRTKNRKQAYCQRLLGNPLLQLAEYVVEIELTVIEQQQGFGLQANDLAAQLRAD